MAIVIVHINKTKDEKVSLVRVERRNSYHEGKRNHKVAFLGIHKQRELEMHQLMQEGKYQIDEIVTSRELERDKGRKRLREINCQLGSKIDE